MAQLPLLLSFYGSLILIFLAFQDVQAVTVEEDLSLTDYQRRILAKFAERMKYKLPEEYMRQPIYLVRWLRVTNFNIDASEARLDSTIQWRIANNMSSIKNEDWSHFAEHYDYSLEVIDKRGQPVVTIDSGKWDTRKAVVSGRRGLLVRWMIKMMEEATEKVRDLQSQGKNVTRWSMIFNLAYFNLVQAGCFQCVTIYTEFVQTYATHFPETIDKIYLVNTPSIFEFIIQLVRPIIGNRADLLNVYGSNKQQWQQALLQDIDKKELPTEYGGTKIRKALDA